MWHVEVQEELDKLKQEKREIKRQLQLADGIMKEDLYKAYYAVSGNEEIVADREIEIPRMEEKTAVEEGCLLYTSVCVKCCGYFLVSEPVC